MATGSRQGDGPAEDPPTGATEPITLTDPDGAVTRVAPWSSWTREQVRAPGGEPALVTRLDQGQLWFSAGRRRSPWRHEVHVGPAVVSTPRGRFHAIAESDGGATVACLAGRTRVVAGLREPVLLGPDQSAAISSDGRTLVVMDRVVATEGDDDVRVVDLTAAEAGEAGAAAEVPELATVGAAAGAVASVSGPRFPELPAEGTDGGDDGDAEDLPYAGEPGPARLGWIPELMAVAALVGLLVAAVWVFTRDTGDDVGRTKPTVPVSDLTPAPTTGRAITTVATTTTAAPSTSAAPTTTAPPATTTGATAVGELTGCRRAAGGVSVTVTVTHRTGPASRFRVAAALADASGATFARASADTDVVQPGSSTTASVLVPVTGPVAGSCVLEGVTAL